MMNLPISEGLATCEIC